MWFTVVGVVGDVREFGLDRDPVDLMYVRLDQNPIQNAHLMVRTRGNPMLLSSEIQAVIHRIDPMQPVTRVLTLDQFRSEQLGTPRVTAMLLELFAAVAPFITIVGISGTLALSVARRSKETGIRMALGATRGNILSDVLRQGLSPVLAGRSFSSLATEWTNVHQVNVRPARADWKPCREQESLLRGYRHPGK